jgi:hypothetical protein
MEVKGKGGAMEFSKEETGVRGLTGVSIPPPDLSALSAQLTSSIRIIEEEIKPSPRISQLSGDKTPLTRKRWVHCRFEIRKAANAGSRDLMDVDGKF